MQTYLAACCWCPWCPCGCSCRARAPGAALRSSSPAPARPWSTSRRARLIRSSMPGVCGTPSGPMTRRRSFAGAVQADELAAVAELGLQHAGQVGRFVNHVRREREDDVLLLDGLLGVAEQEADDRDVAQQRHLLGAVGLCARGSGRRSRWSAGRGRRPWSGRCAGWSTGPADSDRAQLGHLLLDLQADQAVLVDVGGERQGQGHVLPVD